MLGWGIWIMTLGMTYLGLAFMVLAIMPGWPYALYDYAQGEDSRSRSETCASDWCKEVLPLIKATPCSLVLL